MNIEQSNFAKLPTKYGNFIIKAYKDENQEHLAIMSENFNDLEIPSVRIHSECLTGDTLGSLKCDCQNQLELALKYLAQNGGLLIYHRQEGRNIGLLNKVNAYALQEKGFDTVQANIELGFAEDERDYRIIGYIFKDLNIKKISLMTNNPKKIEYVKSLDIEIINRIPAITKSNSFNKDYIDTKKEKMGHLF